ncbi:RepB family plasmid replication initiator protein [Azotobacter chroococcum]|uniref:RepB family plasmid replication initiator protein n=1 Tax=Azotobacter chroococcum TaxID=353 RepID=UPI00103BB623|nr:RepB family plasmid replication initiator protein [Azotobacter chroococcum]TBW34582.1 RepB family plasmid replication initiator protein [Azotobacter chroococcum]
MPNLRVCKSNALVEAAYRLTLGEHRVILACIAQVRRDAPISDQILYEVRALEIAERSGIARQTAYEELEKAAQTLFERYVSVPYSPDGGSPAKRKFRWVQLVDYVPSDGLVRLQFTTAILPYLADLSERYTIYSIADVAKMTSAYGVRLYELLVQWRGVGYQREVELDWLRQVFQLEDRYPSIKDLKKWVIEPAVEQVNEHSPLHVTWDQRKTGRKVSHLIFTFAPKEETKTNASTKHKATPKQALDLEQPRTLSEAELSRLAYPGESREAALRRLNAVL